MAELGMTENPQPEPLESTKPWGRIYLAIVLLALLTYLTLGLFSACFERPSTGASKSSPSPSPLAREVSCT